MKIDPYSQDWLAAAEHMRLRLERDCRSLETAQGDLVIRLQARIALLRELLALPTTIVSRPAPERPLGFESNHG